MNRRAWLQALLTLLCVLGSLAYATRQTVIPANPPAAALTLACHGHGEHAAHPAGHCPFCFSTAFALEAGAPPVEPTCGGTAEHARAPRIRSASSTCAAFDARAPPVFSLS